MKKKLAILLVLLLAVGLVGCGGESPEQAVKSAFDAIKKSDSTTASKYINYDELLKAGESSEEKSTSEPDEQAGKMAESILKHFDYKIISSSQDGDSATVKAEITNIDMKTIMADFISEAFALAFSGLDEETMDLQMKNKFDELVDRPDNKTVTKTVDIKLTKSESSWKIDMSNETTDAIFGGMLSAAEDLNSSFGGASNSDSDSDELVEIDNWLTDDIWNKGFCDISWYASSGTGSTGETLDIDFTLSQLDAAMEKKAEYDAYINGLGDDFSHIKDVWKKLSPEIDALYAQVKNNKPVANDSSTGIDAGKFNQYEEAFSDALYDID
ncbi:MAG TPA: DUF4878 domain-containing protein [Bacillota bacterium]|nr:DUF4878 domain-containing protein [Bacillota bacterium]